MQVTAVSPQLTAGATLIMRWLAPSRKRSCAPLMRALLTAAFAADIGAEKGEFVARLIPANRADQASIASSTVATPWPPPTHWVASA